MDNSITNTLRLKKGFAEMLKGGVIMDVISAEQAKMAEKAGAVSVMALEKIPADIRKEGLVARMADPKKIKEIMNIREFSHYSLQFQFVDFVRVFQMSGVVDC